VCVFEQEQASILRSPVCSELCIVNILGH
jgi:hypothetical protein